MLRIDPLPYAKDELKEGASAATVPRKMASCSRCHDQRPTVTLERANGAFEIMGTNLLNWRPAVVTVLVLILTSCNSVPSDADLTPPAGQGTLLFGASAGETLLRKVDLETGQATGQVILPSVGKVQYKRLRYPFTDGVVGFEVGITTIEEGDYAIVLVQSMNGRMLSTSCKEDAAPVFRIEAGKANVLGANRVPNDLVSGDVLPPRTSSSLAEQGSKLREIYPSLPTPSVAAPIVAWVNFDEGSALGLTKPRCGSASSFSRISSQSD